MVFGLSIWTMDVYCHYGEGGGVYKLSWTGRKQGEEGQIQGFPVRFLLLSYLMLEGKGGEGMKKKKRGIGIKVTEGIKGRLLNPILTVELPQKSYTL